MDAPVSRTLPALLGEQAWRYGDRPAVIAGGATHSYASLADRATAIAAGLSAIGVQPAHRVALLVDNRAAWLEACFGASAAGAVVVPISTWSRAGELAFILRDADVHTLIAMARIGTDDFTAMLRDLLPEAHRATGHWRSEDFPMLRNIVAVGDAPDAGWWRLDQLPSTGPANAFPLPDDDAVILYTSGSTSKPKAVRLAHHDLIENGFNIGERMMLTPDDRVLVSVPLFWAYGAANALPAVIGHGATMVLQDRFAAGGALDLIEAHRCTALYTLPTMTAALITHPDFDATRTATLRTGLTIGSVQDVTDAATVLGAANICNIYGSSETCGNCCVTPADWPLDRRAACQGPPLPGVSVRFVDPATGEPAQEGLIEVAGHLMRGYGGQSALHNAAAFTPDGWYRTGDLGRLNDDGDMVFVGRQSEMIKRSGINVSPAEIEDVLLQHANVTQAAVVGAPDATRGEIIVAFVVAPGVGADDLIAHCHHLASRYKVPDRIIFRDAMPVTATGKLQRQALKEAAHGA